MTQSKYRHWLTYPAATKYSVSAASAGAIGNAVGNGSQRPRDVEFALLQQENQRLRELVASLITPKGWANRVFP